MLLPARGGGHRALGHTVVADGDPADAHEGLEFTAAVAVESVGVVDEVVVAAVHPVRYATASASLGVSRP